MSQAPTESERQHRAGELLEVIRVLAAELHPHKAESLVVGLDNSLEMDLGFDSLSRVELLLRIEREFGLILPEHKMAAADTPADLLRSMEGAEGDRDGAAPFSTRRLELDAVMDNPETVDTLTDVMEWHVHRHGDRPHVTLHGEDGSTQVLTYGQLLERSRWLAGGLLELGLEAGQPVAIMLPTCLEYFYSFLGILLAGGIPVPIYPPARPSQIEDHLRRHALILDNARTSILITVPEAKIPARLLKMQVTAMRHIVTPDDLAAQKETPLRIGLRPHDIAHLQYTSGSTGTPKGVILTHENLLANIRANGKVLLADSSDVFVSWLPLYHDMGLIGAWMGSMYYSVPLHLMSPLTFLMRPDRWLRLISDQRGTFSGGPNFCFELCLNRVDDAQLEGVDLSSWRIAFNGAEPVIPDTLRRFQERFSRYGLRPDAIKPVYGLAEASVGLAFPPPGRPPLVDRVLRESLNKHGRAEPAPADDPNALEFVSGGIPLPGHEVRIVNETGQELGEREEGQLHFKGPSATSGYYRNPEATRLLKHGDWTDSGDMAYIAEGDIFLTGRRKDIIIRAGRNIYPHELEIAIGNLEGIRTGCVAVFGSTDPKTGTERLVALAETRQTDPGKKTALRSAVDALAVDLLGTPLDDVMLAPPNTVLKTSSGKLRRAASREIYEGRASVSTRRAVWVQVLRLWLAGLLPQARRMRRLAGDTLYGWTSLALTGLLACVTWTLVTLTPKPEWAWGVVRWAGRTLLSGLRIRLDVQGREHVEGNGALVVAVNHCSYLDGLILATALPRPWRFVAKGELIKSFLTRLPLRRLGTQFVERFDMQRGVEDARRLAREGARGYPLVFFPEGTFLRQPGLLPFHMGAFQAAVEAGVPVLPVAMRGTRSVLREGQWMMRRSRIQVHVSAPIAPKGSDWNAAVDLRNRVRAEILRHNGEPDLTDQPVFFRSGPGTVE